MVVDPVSPRSDRTQISGTLQQKQIGCHSKLSATLERDMFQVCQSLETWPIIAFSPEVPFEWGILFGPIKPFCQICGHDIFLFLYLLYL